MPLAHFKVGRRAVRPRGVAPSFAIRRRSATYGARSGRGWCAPRQPPNFGTGSDVVVAARSRRPRSDLCELSPRRGCAGRAPSWHAPGELGSISFAAGRTNLGRIGPIRFDRLPQFCGRTLHTRAQGIGFSSSDAPGRLGASRGRHASVRCPSSPCAEARRAVRFWAHFAYSASNSCSWPVPMS